MLLLVFKAGGESYALEARSVAEVVPLVELREAVRAPEGVAGFMNYRGTVIPVLDLTRLISGLPSEPLLSSRIVVAGVGTDAAGAGGRHLLGLMAERVTETVSCRREDLRPSGLEAEPWLGGMLQGSEGLIQLVRIGRLLPEPVRKALQTAAGETS